MPTDLSGLLFIMVVVLAVVAIGLMLWSAGPSSPAPVHGNLNLHINTAKEQDQLGDFRREFHLEQLRALRSEADKALEETRSLERYSLVAAGAIYTFLLTNVKEPYTGSSRLVWLIPPVLVGLAILRTIALKTRISQIAAYIKRSECIIAAGPGLTWGWETYLGKTGSIMTSIAVIVWLALLTGTTVLSWKGLNSRPPATPPTVPRILIRPAAREHHAILPSRQVSPGSEL